VDVPWILDGNVFVDSLIPCQPEYIPDTFSNLLIGTCLPCFPQFFCKYNDPIYVKMEKLEIMIKLASEKNIDQVGVCVGGRRGDHG
jgi:hypothetical protein